LNQQDCRVTGLIGLGQVRLDIGTYSVGLFQVSDRVGLVIGSSSVGSFRVSGRSGRVGSRVI
jgi:hypothetical protein